MAPEVPHRAQQLLLMTCVVLAIIGNLPPVTYAGHSLLSSDTFVEQKTGVRLRHDACRGHKKNRNGLEAGSTGSRGPEF